MESHEKISKKLKNLGLKNKKIPTMNHTTPENKQAQHTPKNQQKRESRSIEKNHESNTPSTVTTRSQRKLMTTEAIAKK